MTPGRFLRIVAIFVVITTNKATLTDWFRQCHREDSNVTKICGMYSLRKLNRSLLSPRGYCSNCLQALEGSPQKPCQKTRKRVTAVFPSICETLRGILEKLFAEDCFKNDAIVKQRCEKHYNGKDSRSILEAEAKCNADIRKSRNIACRLYVVCSSHPYV